MSRKTIKDPDLKGLVQITIKDKRNGCESEPVNIEDLIFRQDDIEFRFPGYTDFLGDEPYEGSLPYKDFLFFSDDYEVTVLMHDYNNVKQENI